TLMEQSEQKMLVVDLFCSQLRRFVPCEEHSAPRPFCVTLEHANGEDNTRPLSVYSDGRLSKKRRLWRPAVRQLIRNFFMLRRSAPSTGNACCSAGIAQCASHR